MKHSPEPWVVSKNGGIDGVPERPLFILGPVRGCSCCNDPASDQEILDAMRAVACVNALAGVEDPARWVEMAKQLMVFRGVAMTPVDLGQGKTALLPGDVVFTPTPRDSERVTELVEAAKAVHGHDYFPKDHARLAAAIQNFAPNWRP